METIMKARFAAFAASFVIAASLLSAPPSASANGSYGFGQRGVNTNMLFVQSQTAYDWPDESPSKFGEPQSTYDYLAAKGHKYVRIGFNWDVMQRGITATNTGAPLDAKYVAKVSSEIAKAKKASLKVVLVLGNPCTWEDRTGATNWEEPTPSRVLLCGKGLTDAHLANLWRRISTLYKSEPAVAVYDLVNEPVSYQHPIRTDMQDPGTWPAPYSAYKSAINASIKAIRDNGDDKYVWVQSLCCTLNHDFASTDPNGPWAVDPLNRIEYSQHMYPVSDPNTASKFEEKKLDPNYDSAPGQFWSDRGYTTGFLWRLDTFGGWCSQFSVKCSIGEVGWHNEISEPETAARWNDLGDEFYNKANYYGFDVLSFGVTTGLQGALSTHGTNPVGQPPNLQGWQFPAPGITRSFSQATVIEKPQHLSK
ncbi:Glycoside hydrolase family 5 domain-containing protein OS=Tsukamurella paurometabola (strain ATCC 8368 / DSM / CCUG 35730 / CIP 100753 / JCM 10117 / KCTC 9821 / NBRC 16120 / NCIMB 702349 / NCTC 13040) OX=521096 GN=Tpau_0078 PE=3 SV=1 [Tsukamurella paurometabola]|uniref:Glycoside hydrolase family 5 domain-containing protein n=2 Tax=Tsukamurella paurometabola TaxID=2061 RepID=D5UPW4_TSUPD|nr:hypothetical protein Tpau_0078 [Tsukamurella paurometabola DSM 20162]SUP41395.1 Cellulase (glycosyl hydrolase family 5) [Tsukamurella paurometabola]